jgi:hypothetical protein
LIDLEPAIKKPSPDNSPEKDDTIDTPTQVKTSFTTAAGEGLTFDPQNLLSIFDEVALIQGE